MTTHKPAICSGAWLPLSIAALITISTGCTMIPQYAQPASPVAAQYPVADASESAQVNADIGWRDFFTDPQLRSLIDTALRNNRDLRVAALNVEAARAQYRIQRAELWPDIAVNGSVQSTEQPAGVIAANPGGGGGVTVGSSQVQRFYSAGVGLTSYELDLFGRIRSLNQARLADYLSLEQTRHSAQIALVAEVANAYFALIADQRLLTVTMSTLESQERTLALTQQRLNAGASNALSLRQVETSVYTAKARLAQYLRQLQQDRNALTQLLGVAALPDDLQVVSGLDEARLTVALAPGLPSDLLARRPDVLAAEQQLIAANANIGAARAAFFPRLSLTGSYGTASTELGGLFESGSTAWSFTPSIQLPIFSGGANRANLDLATLQKDVRIAQYEAAIQTAFREVADSLAARATLDDELRAQQGLVESSSASLALSQLRFDRGIDAYLVVLDSQRAQFNAQQTLETLKLARLQNLVTLYKALGGGWRAELASRTVPSSSSP